MGSCPIGPWFLEGFYHEVHGIATLSKQRCHSGYKLHHRHPLSDIEGMANLLRGLIHMLYLAIFLVKDVKWWPHWAGHGKTWKRKVAFSTWHYILKWGSHLFVAPSQPGGKERSPAPQSSFFFSELGQSFTFLQALGRRLQGEVPLSPLNPQFKLI